MTKEAEGWILCSVKRGRQEEFCTEREGVSVGKNSVETWGGEKILCSVKNEFGIGVFGGGRRKVRWGDKEKICTVGRGGGGRNSAQWEDEEEGRILYKGRWEVKRNFVQLEEEKD
jgi:hypothetical protein